MIKNGYLEQFSDKNTIKCRSRCLLDEFVLEKGVQAPEFENLFWKISEYCHSILNDSVGTHSQIR